MKRYLLDTSVFINAWNKYYRRPVFPGVWTAIEALLDSRVAFSCRDVFVEIEGQQDELYEWAKLRRHIFQEPPEDVTFEMQHVMAHFPQFAAQGRSLNAADPWVIAHARHSDAIVVTDEQWAERQKPTKPPKIPNACEALDVSWMPIVSFLEANDYVFDIATAN